MTQQLPAQPLPTQQLPAQPPVTQQLPAQAPPGQPPPTRSPFAEPGSAQRRRRRTVLGIVAGVLALALLLGVGVALAVTLVGDRNPGTSSPPREAVPSAGSSADRQPGPTPNPSNNPSPSDPSPSNPGPPSGSGPAPGPSTTSAPPPTSPAAPTRAPSGLPPDGVTCTEGTVAVPQEGTSCAFAIQVADAVAQAEPDQRTFSVMAWSPITDTQYTLSCTRDGDLVTCTGGTGAVVYVWQGR